MMMRLTVETNEMLYNAGLSLGFPPLVVFELQHAQCDCCMVLLSWYQMIIQCVCVRVRVRMCKLFG